MKILLLLLCIAFAGCGPKTKEDIVKDLVTEKLKSSLPDFSRYESLNFGTMGTAFLPYEETDQYKANIKALNDLKDSIASLENLIKENKDAAATADTYKSRLQVLQDSATAKNERNKSAKQGYTPEILFEITHAYLLKDPNGPNKKTEDEFYIDKDLKKVVKVIKVY